MSVGIPIKLLHEAKNQVVTVELKTGEMYRGHLIDVDDTMNCLLEKVQFTAQSGEQEFLNKIYVRGSKINFVIVPDMLKYAPMFKRVKNLAKLKNETTLRNQAKKIREQIITQLAPE